MPRSKYSWAQRLLTASSMCPLTGMSSAGSDEPSQDACAHRSYLYQRRSAHDWLCHGSKFPYILLWTFSFDPSPRSAGDIQYDSDVQTRKKAFSPEKNWKGGTRFIHTCHDRLNLSPTHLKNKINAGRIILKCNLSLVFSVLSSALTFFLPPSAKYRFLLCVYIFFYYSSFLIAGKNQVVHEQVLQGKC